MEIHRHYYCFDPKVIDVNVLRKNAQEAIKGDSRTQPAASATIHFHKKEDSCSGREHEVFKRDG